jgi:hypothetical protein
MAVASVAEAPSKANGSGKTDLHSIREPKKSKPSKRNPPPDESEDGPKNSANAQKLFSNCFYVTSGKLFDPELDSDQFANMFQEMQPRDSFPGEDLSIMKRAIKQAKLNSSMDPPPEDFEGDYGVVYSRKNGSGHCVVFVRETKQYTDYQTHVQGKFLMVT